MLTGGFLNIYRNMKDDRKDLKEVFGYADLAEVISWILFVVTLPVVGAAFLNVVKIIITMILPKKLVSTRVGYRKGTMRFANPKRKHLDVQRYPEELSNNNFLLDFVYPKVDWAVKKADQLAGMYTRGLAKILKMIPKFKGKSDEEMKHIAVTVYYAITIGAIIKVVKLLLIKKGMAADTTAIKAVKEIIMNGLKDGSKIPGLDFDNIDDKTDVMFSSKSFAPITKEITDVVGVYGKIFEDDSIKYRDFYSDLK